MLIMDQQQNVQDSVADSQVAFIDSQLDPDLLSTSPDQTEHPSSCLNTPNIPPTPTGSEVQDEATSSNSHSLPRRLVDLSPVSKLLQKLSSNDMDRTRSADGSGQEMDRSSGLLTKVLSNIRPTKSADSRRTSTPQSSVSSVPPKSDTEIGAQKAVLDVEYDCDATSSVDDNLRQKEQRGLDGCWKLLSNENWDAFLKEEGMSLFWRYISCEMTTFEEITVTGEEWNIKMLSPLRNFQNTFRLEEEFEEENFDGSKVKAIASLNRQGNILTIRQTAMESEGMEFTIYRELQSEDRMLLTATSSRSGLTARLLFVRTTPDELPQ